MTEKSDKPEPEPVQKNIIFRYLHKFEDYFSVTVLLLMALLPLIEIIYRNFAAGGIAGSSVVVQHLTLLIAFSGAAIAAREGRLLSLTSGKALFTGKYGKYSRYYAAAVAAAVTAGLFWASWKMVMIDYEYPLNIISGVPNWTAELVMPIAFALIFVRLILKSSERLKVRLLIVGAVIIIAMLGNIEALQESGIVWVALVLVLASIAFGAPIFVALGGAALLLFWSDFEPIAAIPAESYRIVVSPTLPTIPLFTLAG